MEIVVLILIIALTLASSAKRKKQQQARSARPPSQPVQKASAAARAVVERAMAEVERAATPAQRQQAEESEAALARARERAVRRVQAAAQPVRPVAPARVQGDSAVDDEGCLGGSLPHAHTEGESRAEHARHIAAMEARDRAEAPQDLRGVDARQLRRAVVMAEVLGRPKALRMRRGA